MFDPECFLCRKHRGREALPPGGYIHEEQHWLLCHAPVEKGPLGTLFIESRRHVLDFADFTAEEGQAFGLLTQRVYAALRPITGASRIYMLSMMEGIPHFHAWIIPRRPEILERGAGFLAMNLSCTGSEAADLAASLRSTLSLR